jgi:hypothetical protein
VSDTEFRVSVARRASGEEVFPFADDPEESGTAIHMQVFENTPDYWNILCRVIVVMTNADHVNSFRLFELSRAEIIGKDFPLEDREKDHLLLCVDCRSVVEVFEKQFKGVFVSLPVAARTRTGSPRFRAGDKVEIIGSGDHNGRRGTIESVVEPTAGDLIYRYRVRLVDGQMRVFFGFEIGRSAA